MPIDVRTEGEYAEGFIPGAVFASQCAYAVTISGVIWGIIVFSEQHSIWVWSSVVVMLFGLALVLPAKETEVPGGNQSSDSHSTR